MTTIIKRSLASGEISRALRRRVDLEKFSSAVRTMRNIYVRKGGGASNRPGTDYVYGAADPDQNPPPNNWNPIAFQTKLIPWESPSSTDSYVLEFGNGFIRFYRNGEIVTVDSIDNWNAGKAYVTGDLAAVAGIYYYCIFPHTNHTPPNGDYWYAMNGFEYSIPTPFFDDGSDEGAKFNVLDCYFTQNSDLMTITHPNVVPQDLVRVSDTRWMLFEWQKDSESDAYGVPTILAPLNLATSGGNSGIPAQTWGVTAITDDLEESLPSTITADASDSSNPVTLTWDDSVFGPVDQARPAATGTIKGYNIYKQYQGSLFFLAFSSTTSFIDEGLVTPNPSDDSAPEARVELNYLSTVSGSFPSKIGVFQQRTLFGNFPFNIQAIYAGKTGFTQNFTRRFPAGADDSILFQLRGKQISGVRHFADIGELVVFADSGEWIVEGDVNGSVTPTAAFPKQYGANGASADIQPVIVGSKAVYVQAQGSIVRALGFESIGGGRNGFLDEDLTAFAEDLFRGFSIVSMAYQKTPDSILWCVRNDGVMVGLTYIRDQQIMAWHHHDTDGVIEQVCSIPEGDSYAVYIIVKRIINGAEVRYLERFVDREFEDIVDAVFMDASLTFDGRNGGSQIMTLTGGTTWDDNDTLTLTSDVPFFSNLEIGNEMWLEGDDDVTYRLKVTACSTDKIVSVTPIQTIPVDSGLRGVATDVWARAVNTISGLDHLEGKAVSVFAYGNVVASPNNDDYETLTVAGGQIVMDGCFPVVHVGLPYISDLETLDIDTTNGETLINKQKNITGVTMDVQDTRGVFAGPKPPTDDSVDPLERLLEVKIREDEDYGEPNELANGTMEINIDSEWNSNGRVFVRQVDPLPMTILSIAPAGLIPFTQGGG